MSIIEKLEQSNEHNRYKIAFRIYRMITLMEKNSYSVSEISSKLDITRKTAYRMIKGLESLGIPFYNDQSGRWRILK